MSRELVIGIDPGRSGGLAFVSGHEPNASPSSWDVQLVAMPEDDEDLLQLFSTWGKPYSRVRVHIENIPKWTGSAQFAKRTIYGASIATLYGQFKFSHGLVLGLGFEAQLIVPVKWQNVVGCRNTEKLEKNAWKNKLKAHAQHLMPHVKPTLATADAALIAIAGISMDRSARRY